MLKWNAAVEAYKAGNIGGAIREFEEIADSAKICCNIGLLYLEQRNLSKAMEYMTEAVETDEYLAVGFFMRSVICYYNGDYDGCVADAAMALDRLRANNFIDYKQLGLEFKLHRCEVIFNRALGYDAMGRIPEADRDMTEASSLKAEDYHSIIDSTNFNGVPFQVPTGIMYLPPASSKYKYEMPKSRNVTPGRAPAPPPARAPAPAPAPAPTPAFPRRPFRVLPSRGLEAAVDRRRPGADVADAVAGVVAGAAALAARRSPAVPSPSPHRPHRHRHPSGVVRPVAAQRAAAEAAVRPSGVVRPAVVAVLGAVAAPLAAADGTSLPRVLRLLLRVVVVVVAAAAAAAALVAGSRSSATSTTPGSLLSPRTFRSPSSSRLSSASSMRTTSSSSSVTRTAIWSPCRARTTLIWLWRRTPSWSCSSTNSQSIVPLSLPPTLAR